MADTLFDAIHDGRPERLAQLALALALRNEGALRQFLGFGHKSVAVSLEQYDGEARRGWRADIRMDVEGGTSIGIELKLRAHFTPEQNGALERGEMKLVVVPSDRVSEMEKLVAGRATVRSWASLAGHVEDGTTFALLRGADALGAWPTDSILASVAEAEMRTFQEGTSGDAGWRTIYRFLSTLDVSLREREPTYRATGGWSKAKAKGYYGYLFGLGPEERVASWWVGFERKDGTTRLVAYKDKKSAGCDSLPLEADAAAELIVGASSER